MDSRKRIFLTFVSFLMIIAMASVTSAYEGDGILEPGESETDELRRAAQNPLADLISFPI